MYLNITDSAIANNKGSSSGLVNYLEKENRFYPNDQAEYWFNHNHQNIEPYEVCRKLDNNIAKLSKVDAKFFLINISPSQKEIRYLKEQYGELGAKEQLKAYTIKIMDEYARNFKRSGIESSKDLLWYAKLENHRHYSYKDKEVVQGLKKRGELKVGEQMHIQVIVSRKDISNRIKLSPMNTSKGKNIEHSKKLGQFDRVAFKQSGERVFDQHFGFDRKLNDTMAYANIHKNGTLAQREQLDTLMLGAESNINSKSLAGELANRVSDGHFHSIPEMINSIGQTVTNFLEILMQPVFDPGLNINPADEAAKRRKKKKKSQGISR